MRTVFHDLPTAHSSITSGTARTRQRATSNTISDAYEEEDSIPLQEFELSKKRNVAALSPSFLPDLPLFPPLAAIVKHRLNRHSSASDFSLSAEDSKYASRLQAKQSRDKEKQSQGPPNGSSVYHTSLTAPPSSQPPTSAVNKAPINNNGGRRQHDIDSYNAAIPFPDLPSRQTSEKSDPSLPRQSTKTSRDLPHVASSLPEGSTVGNIYKHYVRSEVFNDFDSVDDGAQSEFDLAVGYPPARSFGSQDVASTSSSNPLSDHQLQQSALDLRLQRRAERLNSRGQPPSSALPKLPTPSPRLLPSSSQGIEPSSSYGDTKNLLDLIEYYPQPTNRSDDNSFARADRFTSGVDVSSQPNPANEAYGSNRGPKIHVSQANDEDHNFEDYSSYINDWDQDRQPLEREVSEALRRASNFSAYSDGSIASSVVENYRHFQSEASGSDGHGMVRRHSEASLPEEDIDAQAQAFYARETIPSNWISNDQQIRVPIHQHNNLHNPPHGTSDLEVNYEHDENVLGEDALDWETVGESGVGSTVMLGEEMAHRTGSSIADISDDGTDSTHVLEITEYGSTERIAQHPGNIQYSGDYRQRDLKKTKIPVFLPVYGEHKVNGYLADSNRLRAPASAFNHIPRPLERKHTNPFKSPPPELATKPTGSRPYSCRRRRPPKPNHFPAPTSIKTDSSDDENDIGDRRMSAARLNRPGAFENFSRPFNNTWIDENGEAGPAVHSNDESDKPANFLKPIPQVAESEDRPSSWAHIMTFARGETVPGYNADGSRIVENPATRGFIREHSFGNHRLGAANAGSFTEQKTYGGKHDPTHKERNTLVKGPPGAFYHGLTRKADRSQSSHERPRKYKPSYRRSSLNEPNGLRTLSLVARQDRPITPSMQDLMDIGPDPSLSSRPNDFVYRSPLAPPKRKTWRAMYSSKQWTEFQEKARAEGIYDSHEMHTIDLNAGLLDGGDSVKESASSRHLGEEPCLWGGQKRKGAGNRTFQSPTIRMDQPNKKKKISIIALSLCNLLFPSLLLYHHGQLDWIMLWVTTGEFYSFGRPQKKIALYCFVGWVIAVFFGLVGFLIWWFAIR